MRAPSSAKKIPGLPWNTKKDEKSIFTLKQHRSGITNESASCTRFEETLSTASSELVNPREPAMASPTGATIVQSRRIYKCRDKSENSDMKITNHHHVLGLEGMSTSLFGILGIDKVVDKNHRARYHQQDIPVHR